METCEVRRAKLITLMALLAATLVSAAVPSCRGAPAQDVLANASEAAAAVLGRSLAPSEASLLDRVVRGDHVRLPSRADVDAGTYPLDTPGELDVLSAEFVAWLATASVPRAFVSRRGLRISDSRITGTLDLAFADVPFPLEFDYCHFEESPLLQVATLRELHFRSCYLPGLFADGIHVTGSILFTHGTVAAGEVRMVSAFVGNDLDCRGSAFLGGQEGAICLQDFDADRVILGGGFRSVGLVDMSDGAIRGGFEISNADLSSSDGEACLYARNLSVGQDLLVRGITSSGMLDLNAARIGGMVSLGDSTILGSSGVAVDLRFAHVDGNMQLADGLRCEGSVRLTGCEIRGTLLFIDTAISEQSSDYPAVSASSVVIHEDLRLDRGTVISGMMLFAEAEVFGSFVGVGAEVENPEGIALALDQMRVHGSVVLSEGFTVQGVCRLVSGWIGQGLDFSGSRFRNRGGDCIVATSLVVGGNVFLADGFRAEGNVLLAGCKVGGSLVLSKLEDRAVTLLDLRTAEVGVLADAPDIWSSVGFLYLEGFRYRSILAGSSMDATQRLAWIRRQPPESYTTQPFEQLAGVLREMGAEDEAEEVLIAKARFAATGGSAAEFLWRYFLGPLIGFGYRPFRAFLAASLLIVLSAVFVRKARKSGLFVPREQASGAKPFGLNALVYSLDLFLPIVDLHQLRYWIPGGVADRTIARIGKAKITSGTLLRMLRLWFWFMILAGWLITTIFVLALAGVIRE